MKDAPCPEPAPARPERVSNLTFSELCGLAMQLDARVEDIWQRVVYIQAAMIGVLVFFSQAEHVYLLARGLVFAFYSVNILMAYVNLSEIYRGLDGICRDLARFPACPEGGAAQDWMAGRRFRHKRALRAAILAVAWVFVGVLLFLYPFLGQVPSPTIMNGAQ